MNESDFGKEIKLIFYNEEKIIKFDESRMLFSIKEYNIICIKMKENEFNFDDYLRIDEQIYNKMKINIKSY